MTTDFEQCAVTGKPFVYGRTGIGGRTRYDGYIAREWGGLWVCHGCAGRNHDGIVASHHPGFIERVTAADGALTWLPNGCVAVPPRTSG